MRATRPPVNSHQHHCLATETGHIWVHKRHRHKAYEASGLYKTVIHSTSVLDTRGSTYISRFAQESCTSLPLRPGGTIYSFCFARNSHFWSPASPWGLNVISCSAQDSLRCPVFDSQALLVQAKPIVPTSWTPHSTPRGPQPLRAGTLWPPPLWAGPNGFHLRGQGRAQHHLCGQIP